MNVPEIALSGMTTALLLAIPASGKIAVATNRGAEELSAVVACLFRVAAVAAGEPQQWFGLTFVLLQY